MYWPTLRRVRVSFAVMLAIALPSIAVAQSPMKSRETSVSGGVAVIDMQKLLAEYRPFVQRLEELRESELQASKQIDALSEEVLKERALLVNRFREGSPIYEETLAKIFDKEAEIAAAKRKLRYRFDNAESQLYVAYFHFAQNKVTNFARSRGINLVLNRTATNTDADNVESAQALFGQKIVYERKIDITNDILDQLETGAPGELPRFEWEDKVAD